MFWHSPPTPPLNTTTTTHTRSRNAARVSALHPPRKFGFIATPGSAPRRGDAHRALTSSPRDALAYSRASSWLADYGAGNRNTSISGWLAGRNGRHPTSKAPIDGSRGRCKGLALCRAVPVADPRPEPMGPDLRPPVPHQASHSVPLAAVPAQHGPITGYMRLALG